MKTKLLSIAFVMIASLAQAQLKGKIQEVLSSDIFFRQLKETYQTVQGDEGKAVPHFLEMTMKFPDRISLADFRNEKVRYYALCKEYNQIIDDIIDEVNRFEKLRELKEISLASYSNRIITITSKFKSFFMDLNRYHQEALVLDLLIDVYKFGKPIIQHLIQEQIKTVKRILIEQLNLLKLTPLPWEGAEEVVASKSKVSHEQVVAKIGMQQTDHYRSIGLAPGATKTAIDEACAKLTTEYTAMIEGSQNPEIRDFFSQLLGRVQNAKTYFDANPPVAKKQEVVSSGNPSNPTPASGDCQALKAAIQTLLENQDMFDTKEEMVKRLQNTLDKY